MPALATGRRSSHAGDFATGRGSPTCRTPARFATYFAWNNSNDAITAGATNALGTVRFTNRWSVGSVQLVPPSIARPKTDNAGSARVRKHAGGVRNMGLVGESRENRGPWIARTL